MKRSHLSVPKWWNSKHSYCKTHFSLFYCGANFYKLHQLQYELPIQATYTISLLSGQNKKFRWKWKKWRTNEWWKVHNARVAAERSVFSRRVDTPVVKWDGLHWEIGDVNCDDACACVSCVRVTINQRQQIVINKVQLDGSRRISWAKGGGRGGTVKGERMRKRKKLKDKTKKR